MPGDAGARSDLPLIGFYRNACAPMVDLLTRLSLAAFAVNLATGQ
jgi:hypothetical protein